VKRPSAIFAMNQDQWTAVDRYVCDTIAVSDPALDAALQDSANAGLPAIQVSPAQGRLLQVLARSCGARVILELGTLGGYSTICLARALPPGGRLITLESDPKHAEVARKNIARAGLADVVEIRVGPALETLPKIAADHSAPFELIFIDADKPPAAEYFAWALKLARVGGLIIVDNVVRKGALADSSSDDPNVQGVQRLHKVIAKEPRVVATTLQVVGVKGYDGLTFAVVVK
jgi:predicted O-methyltransferase YrrM